MYCCPLLSVVSLSVISITHGQSWSENIKWKIREMNNLCLKLNAALSSVTKCCADPPVARIIQRLRSVDATHPLVIHIICSWHPTIHMVTAGWSRGTQSRWSSCCIIRRSVVAECYVTMPRSLPHFISSHGHFIKTDHHKKKKGEYSTIRQFESETKKEKPHSHNLYHSILL